MTSTVREADAAATSSGPGGGGGPGGPALSFRLVRDALRRDRVPEALRTVARQHPGVARLRLARPPTYLVSDPDLVRDVLVTRGRQLTKGPALGRARPMLGEGLLTADRERHRVTRRLVQPAFHPARMAGYAASMTAVAAAHGQRWLAAADDHDADGGGPLVDLSRDMQALTLAVVGRALFGSEVLPDAPRVADALEVALAWWEKLLLPGAERLLRPGLPWTRRPTQAVATLRDVVRRLVADHRAALAASPAGLPAADPRADDVVTALLLAQDEGASLTDEEVLDEAITLFLAGHETTANVMTWAFWLLGTHPEVAAALHAEVDALPGPPAYSELRSLPLTYAVVAETMRLYPPAWILERQTPVDLDLGGHRIAAGSVLLASQYGLHRDARFWPEPDAFRPWRWIDATGGFSEDAPAVPRGAWFPFGAGARVCIGESFAWTEAVLVLATLARLAVPEPCDPGPLRLRAAVTLRPADGMPVRVRRRLTAAAS